MFALRTALWVIDVRNVVARLQRTLLSDAPGSFADKYADANGTVLSLAAVESLLYAYEVSPYGRACALRGSRRRAHT